MILHLYHGRLEHDGPATEVDGTETEDWGFDGPELHGVKSVVWTYDKLSVLFEDRASYEAAAAATKWVDAPFDNSLCLHKVQGGDTVRVFNTERVRYEFFGDWSLSG